MLQKFENYEAKINSIEDTTVKEYIDILVNPESKVEFMKVYRDSVIFVLSYNEKKYSYRCTKDNLYLTKFKASLPLHSDDNNIMNNILNIISFINKEGFKEKAYFYSNMYRFVNKKQK